MSELPHSSSSGKSGSRIHWKPKTEENLASIITFRTRRSPGDMYSGYSRLCVCLSLAAFPHYCTDLGVSWGNGRDASSCALLGGFAIDARVSLL